VAKGAPGKYKVTHSYGFQKDLILPGDQSRYVLPPETSRHALHTFIHTSIKQQRGNISLLKS